MKRGPWRAALQCAALWLFSMAVAAQRAPAPAPAPAPDAPAPAPDAPDAPAFAPGAPGVLFELPRCSEPPYDDAQLIAQLELELAVRGFRSITPLEASPPRRHFRVELVLPDCASGSGGLTLRVLDPDRRWLVQHDLPLSDMPFEARPRVLALAIAEALDRGRPSSASAHAPAPADAHVSRPAPVPSPLPAHPSAPTETSSLQLGLAAQHRTPLLAAHPFWGGALGASGSMASNALGWRTELAFATNTTATRLGQMRTDWWSAALGLDLRDRGVVELAVGPRLGLAHVSARRARTGGAADPRPDAFLVLWGAGTELAVPLGRGWRLRGALDLEQPVRGLVLTAGGQRSLSLEGWLLTSGLGLDIGL